MIFIIIIIIPRQVMGKAFSKPSQSEEVLFLSFEQGNMNIVVTKQEFFKMLLPAIEAHFPDNNTHIQMIKDYLSPVSRPRKSMVVELKRETLEAFWLKFYNLVVLDLIGRDFISCPVHPLKHYFTKKVMSEYMN